MKTIDIINKSQSLVENKGILLYLTYHGSNLYGTEDELSDIDVRGLFLPFLRNVVVGDKCNNLSSKDDELDLHLWSLQYYLKFLLNNKSTEALDLLFSATTPNVIFETETVEKLFESTSSLVNNTISNLVNVRFAMSIYYKYNLRIAHYNELVELQQELEDSKYNNILLVRDAYESIVEKFQNKNWKYISFIDDLNTILIGDKMFSNMRIEEFKHVLNRKLSRYGKRVTESKDADWKSISHSIKNIYQAIELKTTGKLTFPLKECDLIKQIKRGNIDLETVMNIMNEQLEIYNNLTETMVECKYDVNFANKLILDAYQL